MNFLTPMKKRAGRFWARAKDHGNEVGSKLRHTVTDVTSDGSNLSSPPRTPVADEDTTLDAFFNKREDLPSPPRNNMKVGEVNKILKTLYPNFAQLRDSELPQENEKYCKLVYAVGKKFFDHLLSPPKAGATDIELQHHDLEIEIAKNEAKLIIDRKSEPGRRFHTLFSVHDANDRQWTLEENKDNKMGIQEYECYINYERLPDIKDFRRNRKADIYEVFNDKVTFCNLKTHYRVQDQGNCFAQAAVLLQFYLQLVHDKNLKKEDAYISDLSRFMRNFYDAKALHEYIMKDEGDTFHAALDKLLEGDYDVPEEFGSMGFDGYVSKLKEHGPAIVKMFVGDDFKRAKQYKYEGKPQYADNEREGHAMLLVGVIRVGEDADSVDGTDLYFILQNFWQHKQFVMVRRDYFRACSVSEVGGTASVNFVVYNGEFEGAGYEAIYAKKAVHDVSLSSHLLERQSSAKTMVKLRSVDSNGHRHTRWV